MGEINSETKFYIQNDSGEWVEVAQEVLKIGWIIKDEERLKKYYMDCIGLLVILGLIDIEKSKQFIASMRGEE